MPKREWTDEERRAYSEAAKERHRLKRIADMDKAAAPEEEAPIVMPPLDGPRADLEEPAIAEPPKVGLPDPFEAFLADLDDETRELLTEPDGSTPQLRAIYDARNAKAKEARRKVAQEQALAKATRYARGASGLISDKDMAAQALREKMNRKVTWTPEIPVDANGNLIDEGYRIDGRILHHGLPVTGTYGEWLSYREQAWRARNHEMDFEGKGLLNAQRRLSTQALDVKVAVGGRA